MNVGYLPDMFGHIAEMPQILKLAGLEHAVVWRGVPSDITEDRVGPGCTPTARAWRAQYLFGSYSKRPRHPRRLGTARRANTRLRARGSVTCGVCRWRHVAHERLRSPVAAARGSDASSTTRTAKQQEYHFTVTSLPE